MAVSRSVSCLLLLLYAGYIFFQMSTHPHLYDQPGGEGGEGGGADANGEEEEEEEEEEAVLGVAGSILWLAIITVVIGLLSEYTSPVQTRRCEEQLPTALAVLRYMVDALEDAAEGWGVPNLFLGAIIIPIVGNAAEHAAAIIFAVKNKMELAVGIAVGSSIQIAIFCVPLLVVTAWALGIELSLNFQPFETGVLLVTVGEPAHPLPPIPVSLLSLSLSL